MKFFMAIAVVTFCGPLTGIAEEVTEFDNPIEYITLIDQIKGPANYELTTNEATAKTKEFVKKVVKENSLSFNQQISLSASYGIVSGESTTSFGFEQATNSESSSAQSLENKMAKGMKISVDIKKDKYYLQMAVVKLYVIMKDGKKNYVKIPTGKIMNGVYDYEYLQNFKLDDSFKYVILNGKKLKMYTTQEFVDAIPDSKVIPAIIFKGTKDCQNQIGKDYAGSTSTTKSGYSCQNWSKQSPHKHPLSRVGNHNLCRNPDGEPGGVWCYTKSKTKRWEYCDVPVCGEKVCTRASPCGLGGKCEGDSNKCNADHYCGDQKKCEAADERDMGCSDDNQCPLKAGDCDDNTNCKTDLICGDGNCPWESWGSHDDCCHKP